jgi:hypothetical protein
MDTLDILSNGEKPEEAKQAKKTTQTRQAKHTLPSGNEAETPEEAQETEEAEPTHCGDASKLPGKWRVVSRRHVGSPVFDALFV